MTTTTAQRRLLEALAELDKTNGGIGGMLLGMPAAIELAEAMNEPTLADVWRAFVNLSSAVQADLTAGATHG